MRGDSPTNGPVHVAITRRIKPGREAEFQEAVREFFKTSFSQIGVHGASMLVPTPGSTSSEYGILRTFANEEARDAFYASPVYQTWKERIAPLTEGEPQHRQLHGLEAWFRSPKTPPPRWKMAAATFLGVFPVAMVLNLALGPLIRSWPFLISNAVFNVCVVALLTWVVMPFVTRLFHGWLNPQPQLTQKEKTA